MAVKQTVKIPYYKWVYGKFKIAGYLIEEKHDKQRK